MDESKQNDKTEIPKNDEILEYDLNSPLQRDNINTDYRNSNYKFLKFRFEEIQEEILLKQDWRIGKGGIFWDGSLVLTKILNEKILTDNKKILKILELGAGTALPSIFAAKLGHSVIITDIKKNINLIKDNLESNNLKANESVKVETLFWENEDDIKRIKAESPVFDVIIGSELIYMDEYFDDLINVFRNFSNSDTVMILSYKIRHPDIVDCFFKKFTQFFNYYHVEDEILLKYYPLKNKLKIIFAKLN